MSSILLGRDMFLWLLDKVMSEECYDRWWSVGLVIRLFVCESCGRNMREIYYIARRCFVLGVPRRFSSPWVMSCVEVEALVCASRSVLRGSASRQNGVWMICSGFWLSKHSVDRRYSYHPGFFNVTKLSCIYFWSDFAEQRHEALLGEAEFRWIPYSCWPAAWDESPRKIAKVFYRAYGGCACLCVTVVWRLRGVPRLFERG